MRQKHPLVLGWGLWARDHTHGISVMRSVQDVAVDKGRGRADSGLVQLGQAIRESLGDRSQAWLATQLGIDQSVISRIISGQIQELAVDRVAEIEKVLDLTPGALLRAAGYVADTIGVRDAITADKQLTPEQKRTLRNVYDLAISSNQAPARRQQRT